MDFEKNLFDEVAEDLQDRIRRSGEVQDEIDGLAVEAKSGDGLITLIVGPPGHLQRLEFDPRTKRLDLATLGEMLVALINDASAALNEEMARRMRSLVPGFDAERLLEEFLRMKRPPGAR